MLRVLADIPPIPVHGPPERYGAGSHKSPVAAASERLCGDCMVLDLMVVPGNEVLALFQLTNDGSIVATRPTRMPISGTAPNGQRALAVRRYPGLALAGYTP
jgi:hypothetical protein